MHQINMAKHLIMGFATNQTQESLEVFLRSARNVYSQAECDIALITNSTLGIENIIDETGTLVLNTPSTYSVRVTPLTKTYNRVFIHTLRGLMRSGMLSRSPEIIAGYHQMIETWHHPHFARWFAYMRVMRTFHQYDKVLLADTKDVVFQAPFFTEMETNKVSIFEDGESFYAEGWNGRWYINAFGRDKYNQVAQEQPICIGVVAGATKVVLGFVMELCDAIARQPFGRIEQAVFNKMYFNSEFASEFNTFKNVSGPVLTMCGDEIEDKIDCRDGVLHEQAGGRVFPIVHMYDRLHPIRDAVQQRYMLKSPHKEELAPVLAL